MSPSTRSKLRACIIAYNEEQLLPDCLDSLAGKVDEIILVDGRIEEFPGAVAVSSDNTAAIARAYGAQVIQCGTPYRTEMEMREQYLVGSEGDWYLVMDADQVLMTPLPSVSQLRSDAYRFRIRVLEPEQDVYPVYLFKHRGNMHYPYLHDTVFSGDQPVRTKQVLSSIWVFHQQYKRSRQRMADKQVKRLERIQNELELKQEWDIQRWQKRSSYTTYSG